MTNLTNRNISGYVTKGQRINAAHFAPKKHRTIADDLRDEEISREDERMKEKLDRNEDRLLERSWSPMGDGTGRRTPVRYE